MNKSLLALALTAATSFSQAEILFDFGLALGGGEQMTSATLNSGKEKNHFLGEGYRVSLGYEQFVYQRWVAIKAMAGFQWSATDYSPNGLSLEASHRYVPTEVMVYVFPHQNLALGGGGTWDFAAQYKESLGNQEDVIGLGSTGGFVLAARAEMRMGDYQPGEKGGFYMEAKYAQTGFKINSVNDYTFSDAERDSLGTLNGNKFTLTFGMML